MSNEGTTEETVDEAPEASEPETEVQTLARRLRNCVDALKELGVDPIALEDDGDDRDELLRAAVARGRTLVQHGKKTAEDDARVREQTLRTVLGGAIDGEKSVVDIARRVARDLKSALERQGAAMPAGDEARDLKVAEEVRVGLSSSLYFDRESPPDGQPWHKIMEAITRQSEALVGIARAAGVFAAQSPDFIRTHLPALVQSLVVGELQRKPITGPPIASASDGYGSGPRILIDVIALKCDPVWQHRGIAKVQVQLGTINDIGEWEEADSCAGLQLGRAELVYKS
jgi:hypothetical protein